jgi:hypothetical protein
MLDSPDKKKRSTPASLGHGEVESAVSIYANDIRYTICHEKYKFSDSVRKLNGREDKLLLKTTIHMVSLFI